VISEGTSDASIRLCTAFTGREWDPETGLYYYRARYYDPSIGRFLSEDPIGLEGGVNYFRYVGNNPVTATDPDGLRVVVHGGQRFVQTSWAYLRTLARTEWGRANLVPLLIDPDRTVAVTEDYPPRFNSGIDAIRYHLDVPEYVVTENGVEQAAPIVILGHELGHACHVRYRGAANEGANLGANENAIREQLGFPRRTRYMPASLNEVPPWAREYFRLRGVR
jgi:RHS repeat-associated protein